MGRQKTSLLGILGHDELLHIAGCLNQGDLKALAATCTRLLQLAYDPQVPGKPWSFVDMDFWPFTRIRMKPKDEMELMVANAFARLSQKRAEQSKVTVCCGVPASNPAQADLERSGRAAVSAEDIQRALRRITDHLVVFRCRMMATDEHFRPLAACHKLKALCLGATCSRSQSSVTDVGLMHLTSLERLEQLHMTGFNNMTIRGLRPLLGHGLRNLDLAKLSSQHLTVQQVLRALSEMCPHLEELDLSGFYRRGADVPASGAFAELSSFLASTGNSLRRLNLGFGIVTSNAVLAALMGFIPPGQLEHFQGARPRGTCVGVEHASEIVPDLQDAPYVAEVQNTGPDAMQAWDGAMGSFGWLLDSRMWTVFTTRFNTAQFLFVDDVFTSVFGELDEITEYMFRGPAQQQS